MPIGRRLGLVGDERWRRFAELRAATDRLRDLFTTRHVTPTAAVNDRLRDLGSAPLANRRASLADLLRRPELGYRHVVAVAAAGGIAVPDESEMVRERVETEIKYSGYLARQQQDAARLSRLEAVTLPGDLDYGGISGLSGEVVEKLSRQRPRSLGQASRISGITPAAVSLLYTHLNLLRRRPAPVLSPAEGPVLSPAEGPHEEA
jgi:tRNA uridine 5-carboxymethylaminomethyl modification enzyme